VRFTEVNSQAFGTRGRELLTRAIWKWNTASDHDNARLSLYTKSFDSEFYPQVQGVVRATMTSVLQLERRKPFKGTPLTAVTFTVLASGGGYSTFRPNLFINSSTMSSVMGLYRQFRRDREIDEMSQMEIRKEIQAHAPDAVCDKSEELQEDKFIKRETKLFALIHFGVFSGSEATDLKMSSRSTTGKLGSMGGGRTVGWSKCVAHGRYVQRGGAGGG
jgi:hypothetical protein